jgi:hypothetical protein
MRRLGCLTAALAAGALMTWANPAVAGPPTSGLLRIDAMAAELDQSQIHKVHRWHCQRRKGWYKGKRRWHRHRRACRDYDGVHPYPGSYWGQAPLPYYGYYEWRRERRNWLWD